MAIDFYKATMSYFFKQHTKVTEWLVGQFIMRHSCVGRSVGKSAGEGRLIFNKVQNQTHKNVGQNYNGKAPVEAVQKK